MTDNGIAQVIRKRDAAAGIRGLHPHMFRHTFAHEWRMAGGDDDSGRVADPPPGGYVVGAGVAAEQDGSTWRTQPPVRLGGCIQRGITLEQQSTAPALLGRRLVVDQRVVGAAPDVSAVLVAQDGIWSGGHDASFGGAGRLSGGAGEVAASTSGHGRAGGAS
jgi:hypothetical protein